MRKWTFFSRLSLLKMFLSSLKTEFWQPCQTKFPRDRKIFVQVTRYMKESESFLQYVLPSFSKPQMFISTCKMQVLLPRRKTFARWPKTFRSMSKIVEENGEILQKIFSLKNIPMITWNSVLTTLPRTFCLKAANGSLNLRKRSKIVYIFLQKSISNEEFPMITYNAILTDLLGVFCHKAQKLFARRLKKMKKMKNVPKKILPQLFLWTRTLQFLQRRPQNIRRMSEKGKNIAICRKSFFPKVESFSLIARTW